MTNWQQQPQTAYTHTHIVLHDRCHAVYLKTWWTCEFHASFLCFSHFNLKFIKFNQNKQTHTKKKCRTHWDNYLDRFDLKYIIFEFVACMSHHKNSHQFTLTPLALLTHSIAYFLLLTYSLTLSLTLPLFIYSTAEIRLIF